jgi:hypothetical protein
MSEFNSNSCSNFNEQTFIDTLNNINDNITKGELQETLKSLGEESCDILTGGKIKKSKKTMKQKYKKMHGGKIPIKNIIKTFLYVLLAALVSLGMNSPNLQTVKDGIMMIYNGQCNTITNRLWSWIGIENPICAMYNNLLFKIIPNALLGNAEAVTKLVGLFSIGFGGPIMVIKQIDNIGNLIENTVYSNLQVENSNPISNVKPNSSENIPLSNELTIKGGKSKRKSKRKRRRF